MITTHLSEEMKGNLINEIHKDKSLILKLRIMSEVEVTMTRQYRSDDYQIIPEFVRSYYEQAKELPSDEQASDEQFNEKLIGLLISQINKLKTNEEVRKFRDDYLSGNIAQRLFL